MSRVAALDRRYAASATLASNGAELVVFGDIYSARLDAVCRALVERVQADGPGVWDELFGASKALRWRLLTHVAPLAVDATISDAVREVEVQAARIEHAVMDLRLLNHVVDAARDVLTRDPVGGRLVLESVREVGAAQAVVVAANARAREALGSWRELEGFRVLSSSELNRTLVTEQIAYYVGPPRFFSPAMVLAPRAEEVTFIFPSWFGDRSLPRSVLEDVAESTVRVRARVIEVPDALRAPTDTFPESELLVSEDFLAPQPLWYGNEAEARVTAGDEVEAHKVLLSGRRAIWLDELGGRIRVFDGGQPPGERVGYLRVDEVSVGTYLVLRDGIAEREAMRERAIQRLGARWPGIEQSQREWKSALAQRLADLGNAEAERQLKAAGVGAASQVRAWVSPELMRPQRARDFVILLRWLGIPEDPFTSNANVLRREVHGAMRELREILEGAANDIDLRMLEAQGHLRLELAEPGYRGMFVSRVLAKSPWTVAMSRSRVRLPFEDGGGQWLE